MEKQNWFKQLISYLGSFLQAESNESSKRLIAILFTFTLMDIAFYTKHVQILELIIYVIGSLIVLLLGLTTFEKLYKIFKK